MKERRGKQRSKQERKRRMEEIQGDNKKERMKGKIGQKYASIYSIDTIWTDICCENYFGENYSGDMVKSFSGNVVDTMFYQHRIQIGKICPLQRFQGVVTQYSRVVNILPLDHFSK